MSDPVTFKDLNFKLTVINALMYEQEIIQPPFDVHEFVAKHVDRKIDIEVEGYEVIPEVKAYFEAMELRPEQLAGITSLCQDGGDEIWLELCPFWDGEDDTFNIKSAEDAALLPKLKKITLFYDEDDAILKAFGERGVEAEWL
jgi:hypothetical protein